MARSVAVLKKYFFVIKYRFKSFKKAFKTNSPLLKDENAHVVGIFFMEICPLTNRSKPVYTDRVYHMNLTPSATNR